MKKKKTVFLYKFCIQKNIVVCCRCEKVLGKTFEEVNGTEICFECYRKDSRFIEETNN